MKLYGAIDLHSNNNVTVLIDEQDQVVYQKRLPNDLPLIVQQLSGYRDRVQGIVVESTYNWYWLVRRPDGPGTSDSSGQHSGDPTIRRAQIHRRQFRRSLARPHSAIGSITAGLYLSERGASGTRSVAQAQPDGPPKNRQSVKHTESGHA
jgi:hypothetical protein